MSIEFAENNMTIFYSKNTGNIEAVCTGKQTLDFFGEQKVDKELYLIPAIIPLDNDLLYNTSNYEVNLETNEIQYKSNYPKNIPLKI